MNPEAGHLSPFAIEALSQGAVDPVEAAASTAHLAACARCRAELEEVRAARAEFTTRIRSRTEDRIVERAHRRRWRWVSLWALAPALGAAAFLILARSSGDVLRVKGGAAVWVFAEHSGTVVKVQDGARLSPGDRLRFEVEPGGLPFLLVASIDAADNVSIYVPFGGTQSIAIDPDHRFVSPDSIQLNAVPGPERLFALLSREPIAAKAVESVLQEIGKRGPAAIRETRQLPVQAPDVVTFLWETGGP